MALYGAIALVIAYVVLFDIVLPLWWDDVEYRWKQDRERDWHV
jgi:hypothetical protein